MALPRQATMSTGSQWHPAWTGPPHRDSGIPVEGCVSGEGQVRHYANIEVLRLLLRAMVPLLLCIGYLFLLWVVPAQASFVGVQTGSGSPLAKYPGAKDDAMGDPHLKILDQLEKVDIEDRFFSDDLGESASTPSHIYPGELISGAGAPRRRTPMLDRPTRFDKASGPDERRGVKSTPAFDEEARLDAGPQFDPVVEFDKERVARPREVTPMLLPFFGREEKPYTRPEKFDRLESFREGGDRVETDFEKKDRGEAILTRDRQQLEQELLKSQETTPSYRTTQTRFFLKIFFFVVILILLLAGTLKGLIPIRFYFFATILILIFWNPLQSMFISIIVALSALLAPLLG